MLGRLFLADIVFLYSSFKMYSYKHFSVFTLSYSFPGIYIYTLSQTSDNVNKRVTVSLGVVIHVTTSHVLKAQGAMA